MCSMLCESRILKCFSFPCGELQCGNVNSGQAYCRRTTMRDVLEKLQSWSKWLEWRFRTTPSSLNVAGSLGTGRPMARLRTNIEWGEGGANCNANICCTNQNWALHVFAAHKGAFQRILTWTVARGVSADQYAHRHHPHPGRTGRPGRRGRRPAGRSWSCTDTYRRRRQDRPSPNSFDLCWAR